jgi:hypothetical protein
MDRARIKACLISLGLMALTLAGLIASGTGTLDNEPGIRQSLPDTLDGYRGLDVLFCQNDQCGYSLDAPPGNTPAACPRCGGKLGLKGLGEQSLLPGDTQIIRKNYIKAGMPPLLVAIVISGNQRRSIHRPQACLVSQGSVVLNEYPLKIDRPNAPPLTVSLLNLADRKSLNQRGQIRHSMFAYWFVARNRETASNNFRTLQTAWDGIVHNIRRRWAYVAISTDGQPKGDELTRLETFIRALSGQLAPDARPQEKP